MKWYIDYLNELNSDEERIQFIKDLWKFIFENEFPKNKSCPCGHIYHKTWAAYDFLAAHDLDCYTDNYRADYSPIISLKTLGISLDEILNICKSTNAEDAFAKIENMDDVEDLIHNVLKRKEEIKNKEKKNNK